MMRRTGTGLAALAAIGLAAWAVAAEPPGQARPGEKKPATKAKAADRAKAAKNKEGKELQWQLAVMTYTFNRFTLFEAIDKSRQVGAEYIEAYSWEKISPQHGDAQLNPDLSESVQKEVKTRLAENKIKLVGYYFHELGKDEAQTRKVFDFCRKMGIQYIVSEPEARVLPLVDKLAQEYKVKVAIHNHPKDPKKPEYLNWKPENVMKMISGCSKWIGCCADNGHWARSGLDGIESLRVYQGRLVSMHLKDVNAIGPDAHDVPYGKGVIRLKDLLGEAKKMGFAGVFSIEYEANMENNVADVAQCIEYFNKLKAELLAPRQP